MNKPEFVTSNEICDTMKLPQYVGSQDICDSLGFSKRTLQRRFFDEENPLPRPCIERIGAESKWEVSIARAWIERERERTNLEFSQGKQGGGDE